MANLITVIRLCLLFVTIWMIDREPVRWAFASMALVIVVFAGDGLDGWVARKRKSASQFGAVFDIAGDRIVETALWVFFAWLRVIPLWIPMLVIVRGGIVDALRSLSYAEGMTAFGEKNMMRSDLTRWLTAGRFMRGLYGLAKAAGFVFLAGYYGYLQPESAGTALHALYDPAPVRAFGWMWVGLSVILLVVRGLPVIFDAIPALRAEAAASRAARKAGAP